jgi:hypothetical protein
VDGCKINSKGHVRRRIMRSEIVIMRFMGEKANHQVTSMCAIIKKAVIRGCRWVKGLPTDFRFPRKEKRASGRRATGIEIDEQGAHLVPDGHLK